MEGTKKQATDDGAGTMSQKNPFILGEEAMDEDGKEPVSWLRNREIGTEAN